MRDVAAASKLLKPYDARLMRGYPVGTRINHVANDDEGRHRGVCKVNWIFAFACAAYNLVRMRNLATVPAT